MANSTPQIRHSPRDSPILIGQDCTVEFPSYPPQSRDPYFLLRDRIEHQMAKVKSVKDIHSIQQDLVTLKQTIDSVLENSTLFPHINASVELPKRMAFYQSMSARLAALKRGAEVGNPELLNQDPQASPSSSTAVTTTFHFEVPCTDQQRHLDHLISVVGNVREQAHQINSEIETQKSWINRIETHFTALDESMERVSKRAVLAYRRSSRNDRAVMATVLFLIIFLLLLAFL